MSSEVGWSAFFEPWLLVVAAVIVVGAYVLGVVDGVSWARRRWR